MNMNKPFSKERNTEFSSQGKSLGKLSMKHNEDIKPNIEIISKNIKKEPGLMVGEIKKEPDYVVKDIKKEPEESDTKLVLTQLAKCPPKSKRRKQRKARIKKSLKKVNAKVKKRISKKCKKSFQTKKTENSEGSLIPKKSIRKRKRKTKGKNRKKSKSLKSPKKEANTLLDQQNNGSLHLFGFKDELEYFSSESDHEEFKETSSKRDINGKRTSLSSLNARKKVILTLKSTPINPSSRPKPIIQPPKDNNVDLLGSILESQSLWHSKNSHIKVNEDGRVEVIDKGKKNLKEIAIDKESNQHKNIIPAQARNDPNCTLLTPIKDISYESLNLNENVETHLTETVIKVETHDTAEAWEVETIIDQNKNEPREEKIKVEIKEERKNVSKSPPNMLSLQEHSSSASEYIFVNSPKTEKSDDEYDDCPIFSTYSKASKIFSLERYKERQIKFPSDQSEIRPMQIKGSEKNEVKGNILKRLKNYQEEEKDRPNKRKKANRSPSPKRIKEEREGK